MKLQPTGTGWISARQIDHERGTLVYQFAKVSHFLQQLLILRFPHTCVFNQDVLSVEYQEQIGHTNINLIA